MLIVVIVTVAAVVEERSPGLFASRPARTSDTYSCALRTPTGAKSTMPVTNNRRFFLIGLPLASSASRPRPEEQRDDPIAPKDGPRMLDTWIHPCHAERHARVWRLPPTSSWVGSGRIADANSVLSSSATSDLGRSLACVLSPRLALATSSSTISSPHSRTLLILRGTRMDPTCWQPEKGCPAVGLTWVCWHS